jgi:hypothetical protein
MIYIRRKSKNMLITKIIKKTLTDAKLFLYELSNAKFEIGEFYVLGSDHAWEMEDLIEFFSELYLLKNDTDTFDIYYVNPKIKKTDRQRDNNIKLTTYKSIAKRIEKEYPDYKTNISIKIDRIAIEFKNDLHSMIIIIDDKLNILDAYIETTQNENILSTFEEVKKRLNNILIKRRSYYKRKVKEYDHK